MLITAAELAPLFDEAFAAFLEDERENLLTGIAEQNLCGRLAMRHERLREACGLNGYFVDTQYNRNGGQVKTIIDEQMQIITIRCDIILHSRGRIPTQDNLIAIEMKRSNHAAAEKEKDRMRLRATTRATYDGIWSADGHIRGKIQVICVETPLPACTDPLKHETSLDEFPAIRTGNFLLQTGKSIAPNSELRMSASWREADIATAQMRVSL